MAALHSFDVFDTLVQRTTLDPIGIFFRVQERMRASHLNFPAGLIADYPAARMGAESNVRYAYRSTFGISREIAFADIFQRLTSVYGLNTGQSDFLAETELACELEACQPRSAGINQVLALLERNERVVLVSDMYLPETFVRKLLAKAEPRLAEVPLYLSSTRAAQKTTGELFKLVATNEGADFSDWTHYGDNPLADGEAPGRLGIKPVLHPVPRFNDHERALVRDLGSYDAYCLAALMARYRFDHAPSAAQEFTYTRVALYLVTYVLWVLNDAIGRGIECLYFISRDGHHLKRIADAVIEARQLSLSTHYLQGSRKVWWVPSLIDGIDAEFFLGLESLRTPCRVSDVLDSLSLDVCSFQRLFPAFSDRDVQSWLDPSEAGSIAVQAKASEAYTAHILDLAASRRALVCQYLEHAVDVGRRVAFVEYWGRGFTQTCLGRLLSSAHGRQVSTEFYYARSIYQNDPSGIRRNFTVSKASLLPVERLFANFPQGTVMAYARSESGVQAVTAPRSYDAALFTAMEALLPRFAVDVCKTGLDDRMDTLRRVFDWAIGGFPADLSNRVVWKSFAPLKDVNRAFGEESEFAPAFSLDTIWQVLIGRQPVSESIEISLKRSHWLVRWLYHATGLLRSRPLPSRPAGADVSRYRP
jgi:hypothetical protein